MKRVALYVRVSSQEQKNHGLSVDSQITALKEYASTNNYYIVDIYNDAGISARKRYTKRPALLKLLEDIKNGKIDLVLFTKLDRWFRSVSDYYEVQKVLDDKHIPWRAIWEDYETETSTGVFKVNIMLAVAQSEADRTSERVKSIYQYKRDKGDYVGRIPYGYIRKNGKLEYDPNTKEVVEKMFNYYLTSYSPTKTAKFMQDLGYPCCSKTIRDRTANPIYAGNYNGQKVPAYISQQDFKIIQARKKSYVRQPKNPKVTYLFTGLLKCGYCGRNLRTRLSNPTFNKYYACTGVEGTPQHAGINVSERKIEKLLLDIFDTEISKINYSVSVQAKELNTDKQRKKLNDRLARIGIRFEDGDISVDEYRSKRFEILTQLAELDKKENIKPIVVPDNWKDIYAQLTPERKRAFWFPYIESITFVNEDKYNPTIKLRL